MPRASVLILPVCVLAAACSESSTQSLNAEQQRQLNDIAAATSEGAGNEAAQNGQEGDLGDAYRAGASAPPRQYR